MVECTGNVDGPSKGLIDSQPGAFGQSRRQCVALEVLHDEKRLAPILSDVIEGADVRMIQGGNRPGLPFEPLVACVVHAELGRKHFSRTMPEYRLNLLERDIEGVVVSVAAVGPDGTVGPFSEEIPFLRLVR